jgi:hypothetical protein
MVIWAHFNEIYYTWTMSSETGKQLAVFELKVLRKILGSIKTIAGEDDMTMN